MSKLRKTFHAVYEQYRELDEKPFKLIRKITKPSKDYDAEVLPMYEIEIEGQKIVAWPEEVEDLLEITTGCYVEHPTPAREVKA